MLHLFSVISMEVDVIRLFGVICVEVIRLFGVISM